MNKKSNDRKFKTGLNYQMMVDDTGRAFLQCRLPLEELNEVMVGESKK